MALIAVAGIVLDAAAAFATRRHLSVALTVMLLGAAGMGANLLCAAKRLMTPVYGHSIILGLSGPAATITSYAIFGLLSGVVGAALGLSAAKLHDGRGKTNRPGPGA